MVELIYPRSRTTDPEDPVVPHHLQPLKLRHLRNTNSLAIRPMCVGPHIHYVLFIFCILIGPTACKHWNHLSIRLK